MTKKSKSTDKDARSTRLTKRNVFRSHKPYKLVQFELLACCMIFAVLIIALGATQNSQAATSIQVKTNLKYGTNSAQVLDVYQPVQPSVKLPIVILVHGGSWTSGDKSGFAGQANQLANAGYVVFDINYRLATSKAAGYPMEVNDVKAATRWAIAHATIYNANSKRVGLVGGSAGANLVALAGEQLNATTLGTVKTVVTLSAPTDLIALVNGAVAVHATGDTALGLQYFLGCKPSLSQCTQSVERAASPLYNVKSSCPSFYVLNSSQELIPLSQAQNFVNALNSKGCKTKLTVVPGTAHAIAYWPQEATSIINYLATQIPH